MNRRAMARRDAQTPSYYVEDQPQGSDRGLQWWPKIIAMVLLTGVVAVVFVHMYWGPGGVRIFGYIMLAVLLAFGVWGVTISNMAISAAHTRSIVRSTTQALIDVQVSDDSGEQGRIAAAIQGAHHDSTMMARRTLTLAQQLANEQKQQNANATPSFQELVSTQFGSGLEYDEDDGDDDMV